MMTYPGITAPGMYALSARLLLYVFIFETVPTPATYDVLDTGCVPRLSFRSDDVSRNHCAWNVRVVGAIIAVRLHLRDRTHASHIRCARYRVRAENVIDGTERIFGAHKIRKRLVQKVHSDGHVNHGARSAPRAQA